MPDDTTERWLPIPGWEDRYEVSDLGRVRTIARRWSGTGLRPQRPRIRKIAPPRGRNWQYPGITLYGDGRYEHPILHALVARVFLGPRPPGWQVNHIDGDKLNARLSNLEYVPPRRNVRHAYERGLNRGRRGEESPNAKLTNEDVRAIRCLRAAGFPLVYVGALFGVDGKHVWRIEKRLKWGHIP